MNSKQELIDYISGLTKEQIDKVMARWDEMMLRIQKEEGQP